MTQRKGPRRITAWCRSCHSFFRYQYSGRGPFRNYCPRCDKIRGIKR